MNDEIREAIMQFQTAIDFKEAPMPMNYSIDLENAKILLDYITNLQQENERLKELNAELKAITKRPTPIDYAMIQKRYEDYKSRCEKASEYIDKQKKKMYKSRNKIAMFILMIMNKEKTPYLIENKERDTFTFYVKGTKPYLDLEKRLDQLTNSWNELEEWLKSYIALIENPDTLEEQTLEDLKEILDKMNEIKEGNNVSSRD